MRSIAHLALALLAILSVGAVHADELPSATFLGDMIAPPQIISMALSPDGKRVAGIGYSGRAGATSVFLIDTDRLSTSLVALPSAATSRYEGRLPIRVNWAGNDVLAVDFSSEQSESIDLNGKKLATLGERFIRRLTEKGVSTDFALALRDIRGGDVDLVNVRTGERRSYRVSLSGEPMARAFDAAGQLRAVTMRDTSFWSERTRISNWYRADERSPWKLLQDVSVNEDFWIPVRVLPEPDALAVWSRHERDTYALFRYDAAKRQHVEVMAGHPNEDILDVRGLDDANLESVVTSGMKPKRYWFDPRWARLQASIDAELPDRVNTLTGDPEGRVLIASFSDIDPGRWFLLNTSSMTMRELGERQSRVEPTRMRAMETTRYTARDGLTINAYLTRPVRPSGTPAPMIVLIHGGPNARDRWGWNEEVQVLAAQGYLVFQPQFRGSSGFGRRFEEAGYLQWGRAMEDDITDGVNDLVARKIADPSRICIYGASYGGYAALWGVIKTPTLYKCGVSFAGVSDLGDMLSHSLLDDSDATAREIQRVRIGDPAKQREQFAEVSPLKNAARVQVPMLIAHGERDTRVLPSQSEKMVAALRAQGKSVEWVPFPNEGHGLVWPDDRLSYYATLLSFLRRHLGDDDREPSSVVAAPSR
ncbi:MAG: S9 family peptidase [Burkholderiales bacterium]